MVFLSNKGTVGTDTMPSKLHKASLQSFHHKGKHMLNFIALRKINSNSKNEQTTQDWTLLDEMRKRQKNAGKGWWT